MNIRDKKDQIYKEIDSESTKKKELVSDITEIRFVENLDHFPNIMQIYDNKVSYITFTDSKRIGVLIEDPDIYEMHKMLFNAQWSSALE